jgi:hypothetical protein
MKNPYLLCPQCGSHRLYVENEKGDYIYFHVGYDFVPFPTEESKADLTGLSFDKVYCVGCAWVGRLKKLVKTV